MTNDYRTDVEAWWRHVKRVDGLSLAPGDPNRDYEAWDRVQAALDGEASAAANLVLCLMGQASSAEDLRVHGATLISDILQRADVVSKLVDVARVRPEVAAQLRACGLAIG